MTTLATSLSTALSFPGRLVVGVIRIYQMIISPALPRSCRFYPTCSEYAAGAVTRHGLWRGLRLALVRILKCHPWHSGGHDPVP